MKLRFGKPLFIYFCSAMIAMLLTIGGGIYYYWNYGPANIDHVAQVFESTIQLDELEKSGGIEEVKKLVSADRSREAIKYFTSFQKKISTLNQLESIEEYEELDLNLINLKKNLNNMLSFSSKATLINVLRTKVTKFEDFVVKNQWRTLTRVSKKINAKISIGETRNPSFFSFRKMKALEKSILGDIDYMESVTRSSILANEDKNLIYIKLNALKTELSMLSKSVASLKGFYGSYIKAETTYKNWVTAMEPKLALSKIKVVKNSQNILYGMIGGLVLVALLLIGGFVTYIKSGNRQRISAETEFLGVIKEGLIPVQANISDSWSQTFKEEIDKYREYMHKRMSFGSIFQDAMPFSSILLDSNLNLVWANTLFYEHWSLGDKVKNDQNVSWDFLQQFTNLGENDPVLGALKENLAGIYQIQVKTENAEEAAPFEMYVSPVEYAGQKRIMVIFYPLRSLEETLGNQMKSLVSPVVKTLDSLISNQYSPEFVEKVKADFNAAGIENIFEKFDELNSDYNRQKDDLMNEIEQLETSLFNQYKMNDEIKLVTDSQKDIQGDAVSKFTMTKDHIISVVDLRSQFEEMLGSLNSLGNRLFEEELELLSKASDVNEIMAENSKALEALVVSRDEFKKLKSQVDLYRARVGQIVENSSNKGIQGVQRLKNELKEFETVLSAFSKVATSLDVGLSKIQIIMQGKEMPALESTKEKFESLRSQMEEISIDAQKLSRAAQSKDEELIKSLKGLFSSFQNLRIKAKEFDELLINQETTEDFFQSNYDQNSNSYQVEAGA